MATGDIKGNIALLERLLRHLKYPAAVDDVGWVWDVTTTMLQHDIVAIDPST